MKNKNILLNPNRIDANGAHKAFTYSTTDINVIEELTDNCIEHNSTEIQITLDETCNSYIIEDNGKDGIPLDIFKGRYHTMYAAGGERKGLGFFGVGSMTFSGVADKRIVITKNKDGIFCSIWNTSKSIENARAFELNKIPKELLQYEKDINRFIAYEEGNGTMVILPKKNESWGQHKSTYDFRKSLQESFQTRYGYHLYNSGNKTRMIIRVRNKRDKFFTYPIFPKNILPNKYRERKSRGIRICTWRDTGSSGKNVADIYYAGVKVGTTGFVKTGTRKKAVAVSSAESKNMRQVIMCDSNSAHLLQMNPVKTGFKIKNDRVNTLRAESFTHLLDEYNKSIQQQITPAPVCEIPEFYKQIPDLYKAIEKNNGKYLSSLLMEFVEDLKNPKSASISIDRKLARAAKKITQNNGGNNE